MSNNPYICQLFKQTEVPCSSYETGKRIIVGPDSGAAVWIQPVKIDDFTDRILQENVHAAGIEIFVEEDIFRRLLKPVFIAAFDPELPQNKYRFTYAFSDEGRYLKGFEENCLEHNFFTYQQMMDILKQIEQISSGESGSEEEFNEFYLAQLKDCEKHLCHLMETCPESGIISVMS